MRRILCALTAALLSVPATHADVLDQSQTAVTSGSYFAVGTNPIGVQYVVGQVFTAGMDGYLKRVQVLLENDSASPVTGGLLLSVQTVTTDGLPSGREIASDSIAVCADPAPSCVPAAGSPGWVEFSLPPAIVSAGTRYALVLRAWGGGYLRWYYHVSPSLYTGGYAAANNGSGWFDIDYDDATFRTYVAPPVLDQSQTAVGGYKIVNPQHPMAQTFVPAVTGYLRRIRLLLENQTASSPIAVSILLVDRAHPSAYRIGPEIAGATIPVAHLPSAGYPGWVDVTLDYLWMVAGTEYAVVLSPSTGSIKWFDDFDYHDYTLRTEFYWEYIGDLGFWKEQYWADAAFETYVLPPVARSMPPPPREISPCINRVCPETKGGLTPADYVDGIKTHFLFKEKLNGAVGGTFSFTDEWPDGVSFQDCTTESNTCRLSVTTFKCTGPNAMTVAGSFKRAGDAYGSSYELNLTGTRKGSGTIILKIPKKTYTFTHDRIVEVSCP
jgi:hypothetical protein